MSIEESWGHFFKPEVRKQGFDLVAKSAAVLSQGTDTQIEGYVKGSTPARVSLRSDSIADETFTAACTCPASGKGQFCKHIWAMLLLAEEKAPDFLESKREIEKVSQPSSSKTAAKATSPPSLKTDFKEKQADYRKQQYQRQKQRAKDLKHGKKQAKQKLIEPEPSYPEEAGSALQFFSENGFPLEYPVDKEALNNARRILSRVFHPDKGGTHEEIVVLNRNFGVLMDHS